jgi:AcrR family transcriptional regulator
MTARPRRDAARNRELLVDAARSVFSSRGADAPLEDVAAAAGVSRTTLHRHFPSREALTSAVMEQNVTDVETLAADLSAADDGIVPLYHHALDIQLSSPAFAQVVVHADAPDFADLAARTARAFDPLVARGREAGVVHPGVTTRQVLLTFPMALAAVVADRLVERAPSTGDVRAILHRGLFTTAPPSADRTA